ncbi:C10 family peptidase [Candidatus Cloacimonadota bacterium]
MKKTLILIILMITLRLFSSPVSLTDATDVAEFYLELYCDTLDVDNVVEFKNDNKETVAYIANLDPDGFIALSVDTDIQPIISYSFINDLDFDNHSNNILYHMLLKDMNGRIELMNSGVLPYVDDNNLLWTNYINQDTTYFNQRPETYWPPQSHQYPTGGWLQTAWWQTGIYNNFCPIDPATNNRSKAGCVAIAIAQILNYHEYIGNKIWSDADDYLSELTTPNILIDDNYNDYDFPSFPALNNYLNVVRSNYLTGNITDEDISAVCFVAGVACEMQYSFGVSGIYYSDYSDVILDKFDYYTAKYEFNIPSVYIENLIPNMKNAQPAIINIENDDTGHSIVCDGYAVIERVDYFHLNFGWGYTNPGGGITPTTAWYDLPDFPFNYDFLNSPIYDISPPGSHGLLSGSVTLNSGCGILTDVTIEAGNDTIHPDENGYYEIELYNGNYNVETFLFGYADESTEVEIVANQVTGNVDFELDVVTPNYIYVPNQHNDIQSAIEQAEDGDIIIVSPGTYFENINFLGKKIKVASCYYLGQNEDFINTTIINGNQNGTVVTFNNGEDFRSSLEGFTITGGLNQYAGGGIRCYYSTPKLLNLKITGNEANYGSGIYVIGSEIIIQNVEVFENNDTNSSASNIGSVFCVVDNALIENSLIYNNSKVGVVSALAGSQVTLNNLSIYDNDKQGLFLSETDLFLNNSLVWNNDSVSSNPTQIHPIYGNLTINYSDIQGGIPAGATGSNNIDLDPLLFDPANGDFQPKWTASEFSPLIDAGDPSILDPDGTPSDIGAVRARDHKIDSIELIEMTEGINWKCLPVIDTVFTGYDVASHIFNEIQQIPFPALEEIEFQDGVNIYYDVNEWQNNTRQFTSYLGCKIHMNDPYTLQITGFLEDPYHVIELELGDNWIGFYLEGSMKPLDAFEAVLDDINMIQTKTFTLNKTALGWLGAANWTINYDDLVVVHCTNDCSFYWGEDGGGTTEKSSRSSSQDFEYTEEADYLPVYVELDNQALGNPTEIGLFVNGECKGAEVITDSLVQLRAYVMNDTTVFDPGDMELQLSYGSRSLNTTITDFKVKHDILDEWESNEKYITQGQQNYYLISLTDTENNIPVVNRTTLSQNYPNPFNPTTTINYSIAEEGTVELTVYNIKGQKVVTLVNEIKEAGQHSIVWNGKDNNNKTVSSGIYFYRLSTGKKIMKKKMLLLK